MKLTLEYGELPRRGNAKGDNTAHLMGVIPRVEGSWALATATETAILDSTIPPIQGNWTLSRHKENAAVLDGQIPAIQGTLDAKPVKAADLNSNIPAVQGSLGATYTDRITLDAQIPAVTGNWQLGKSFPSANLDGPIPAVGGSWGLSDIPQAQLNGTIPPITGHPSLGVTDVANLNANIPAITGSWTLSRTASATLLEATFTTAQAAPLPSPFAVDVGSISVDTGAAAISVANGLLLGDASVATKRIYAGAYARAIGRTFFYRARRTTSDTDAGYWGWGTTTTNNLRGDLGIAPYTTFFIMVADGVSIGGAGSPSIGAASNDYDCAAVLRDAGGFVFYKPVADTAYKLGWIGHNAPSANLYANFNARLGTYEADNFVVKDLGNTDSRFATEYGLATYRNTAMPVSATSQATLQTISATSSADGWLQVRFTSPASGAAAQSMAFRFREQDANNYWELLFDWTSGATSGNIQLVECAAGTRTARASWNGGIPASTTANYKLLIRDTTYGIFRDNTSNFNYGGTATLKAQTSFRLHSNTFAAAPETTLWPREVTL